MGRSELTATIGFDSTEIQRLGDVRQFRQAGLFHRLLDDVSKFLVLLVRSFGTSCIGQPSGFLDVWTAEFYTTKLRLSERLTNTGCNHLSLSLSDCHHDVTDQLR